MFCTEKYFSMLSIFPTPLLVAPSLIPSTRGGQVLQRATYNTGQYYTNFTLNEAYLHI